MCESICGCEGVCTVLVVVFVNTRHLCVTVFVGGVCGGVCGTFTRGLINVSNVPGICFFTPLSAGYIFSVRSSLFLGLFL